MKKLKNQIHKYKKLKKPIKWLDCVGQTGWLSSKEMDEAKPADCVTGEFWICKFESAVTSQLILQNTSISVRQVITKNMSKLFKTFSHHIGKLTDKHHRL